MLRVLWYSRNLLCTQTLKRGNFRTSQTRHEKNCGAPSLSWGCPCGLKTEGQRHAAATIIDMPPPNAAGVRGQKCGKKRRRDCVMHRLWVWSEMFTGWQLRFGVAILCSGEFWSWRGHRPVYEHADKIPWRLFYWVGHIEFHLTNGELTWEFYWEHILVQMEDIEDVSIVSVNELLMDRFLFLQHVKHPCRKQGPTGHIGGAAMGELFNFLLVGFWRQCTARAVCWSLSCLKRGRYTDLC